MSLFFTSDTHFYHTNIIKYCDRPFNSVKEMNQFMIDRWNSMINEKDTVYHLGDFALCGKSNLEKLLNRLNGKIVLCAGSHDRISLFTKFPDKIVEVKDINLIKIKGYTIFMSHYCHRIWPMSHYNSYHCFGHNHCKLNTTGLGKVLDVGVDCHGYSPWSLEELLDAFESKPDNNNLVK